MNNNSFENSQLNTKSRDNPVLKHNKKLNIKSGFGANDTLIFDTPCKKPELKTPMLKENYLGEFITEEEKAIARHNLGLYNKHDIVAMSLLTAEDQLPSSQDWNKITFKHLRKGDQFFAPITSFDAVIDFEGNTLSSKLKKIDLKIDQNKEDIIKINNISDSKQVSTLGDVKLFLKGFDKEVSLYDTINNIDRSALRFEKTGQI